MHLARHSLDPRLLALEMTDASALVPTFYLASFGIDAGVPSLDDDLPMRALLARIYTFIIMICFVSIGLYEHNVAVETQTTELRAPSSVMVSVIFAIIINDALGLLDFWRIVSIATPRTLACTQGVLHIFLWLVRTDVFRRRILHLGDTAGTERVRALETERDLTFFRIACIISLAESQFHNNDQNNLLALCRADRIDEIVVAARERRDSLPLNALLRCRFGGIRVVDYADFVEQQTGKVGLDWCRPSWLIFNDGFVQRPLQDAIKRSLDVLLAAIGLFLVAPILLVAAAAIKLEDGGPVLFRQTRVGRNSQHFLILKLRTMRVDAERDGPQWATPNDSRVTRVGRILRRTRIDELPQLIHILKGEMSFVGPRPERPEFVELISRELPLFPERHLVRPGLAGWAQLNYPYAASLKDARIKLEYDLYYVKNRSLIFDILILL